MTRSHLCNPALHDKKMWIVDVQLYRSEQIWYSVIICIRTVNEVSVSTPDNYLQMHYLGHQVAIGHIYHINKNVKINDLGFLMNLPKIKEKNGLGGIRTHALSDQCLKLAP